MTCTKSILRIGERPDKKRKLRNSNNNIEDIGINSDNKKIENGSPPPSSKFYNKVHLYYETDESITPLPPFLSMYISSKTRTIYDQMPSLKHDFIQMNNNNNDDDDNNNQEDEADENRIGERSLCEVIRGMDVMSHIAKDAMIQLTKTVKNELNKSPEHRSWSQASRYRAAHQFLSTKMKPIDRSYRARKDLSIHKIDLNQLMTKFLINLQQRCLLQNEKKIYLQVLIGF